MNEKIPVLELTNHLPPGGFFYIGRQFYRGVQSCGLHTHRGFAEVSWVEQGTTEHRINGRRQILKAGDVVLFREKDVHGFHPVDAEGFILTNVAFLLPVLETIRRRYFMNREPWIWAGRGGEDMPNTRSVDGLFLDWLRTRADALASERQTTLQLDCFLMELLRRLDRDEADMTRGGRAEGSAPGAEETPGWLAGSIAAMRQGDHLREGVGALVRMTGRSREHVSRCVRKHTGRTATDLINDLRLDYAARELRMTERAILEIAWDSGISSLAHFYRVFKGAVWGVAGEIQGGGVVDAEVRGRGGLVRAGMRRMK